MSNPWHEPRPIAELDRYNDWPEVGTGDCVLVYNPCDGWHLLWTMRWSVDQVISQDIFEYWMPGPPEPAAFDRDAWMAKVSKIQVEQ